LIWLGFFVSAIFGMPLSVPFDVGCDAISLDCFGQITTIASLYRRTFSPRAMADIDY
jgi:hypothetical protein